MTPEQMRMKAMLLRAQADELDADAAKVESVGDDALERMRKSCQGKKRYATVEAAGSAAAARQKFEDHPLRIYECGFCRQFHLTKAPLDRFASFAHGKRP